MTLNTTDKFTLALMDANIHFNTIFNHHTEDIVIPASDKKANIHFIFKNQEISEIKITHIDE